MLSEIGAKQIPTTFATAPPHEPGATHRGYEGAAKKVSPSFKSVGVVLSFYMALLVCRGSPLRARRYFLPFQRSPRVSRTGGASNGNGTRWSRSRNGPRRRKKERGHTHD